MILKEEITFVPLLDRHKEGSLFTLFDAVIENIYFPASQITRLANSEENYLVGLKYGSYIYLVYFRKIVRQDV